MLFTTDLLTVIAICVSLFVIVSFVIRTRREERLENEQYMKSKVSNLPVFKNPPPPPPKFYVEPKIVNVKVKGKNKRYKAVPKSGRTARGYEDFYYYDEFGGVIEDFLIMEIMFDFMTSENYSEDNYADLTEEIETVEELGTISEGLISVTQDITPEIVIAEVEHISPSINIVEEEVYYAPDPEPEERYSSSNSYESSSDSYESSSDYGSDDGGRDDD